MKDREGSRNTLARGASPDGQRVSRLRRGGAFLALLAALGAPSGAAAQDASGDLTELPLEQLLKIDVVYGASRYEQKVTEAPSSVTIVTAEEIRLFGYETLAEVLAGVRGFYTTYDRNYTYLGVRGFSRPSDFNSRILLLVDGHRVNENIFGSVYIGPEQILDLDLVDRIEVIRGPGSSLYGTGAFFAIVNVLTRRADDLKGVQLSALGGSYGTRSARVAWGRLLEGGGEILLSASGLARDGQNLFYEEFGGKARDVDGEGFGRGFARFRLGNLTVQALYNRRDKTVPTASYGTVFGSPGNDTVDAREYLDVRYDRRLGSRLDVLARVYYDNYYYRGRYDYGALYTEWYNSYWFGAEIHASFKPSERHRLTLGGEFRDHPKQATRYEDLSGPFFSNARVDGRDHALFIQDEIRAARNVTLSLGLRYDRYSSFGGSANPRVAVLFHPSPNTIFKAIYGEAFRAPNPAELFLASTPNPDLDAESIRETSLIFERYVGRGFLVVGNLFGYQVRRLIGLDPSATARVNLDPIESHGAEVEIEKRWEKGRSLRASYAWQNTHETGDLHLSNSPFSLLKLHAGLPFLNGRLVLGAEALHMSDRLLKTGEEVEGHLLANLNLTAPGLARGLDLSASVLNLFDTDYSDPAASFHTQVAIPQNGRNARLRLTWKF